MVQVQPGKVDEAARIFRDSVIPAARQQKGFQSIVLLTDRNTHRGISIGFWETQADMKASEDSGYLQEQFAKFRSIFAAPPTPEYYEVSAQS